MKVKVDGYSNLIKDTKQNSISSCDKNGLARAKEARAKILLEKNKNKILEEKINLLFKTIELITKDVETIKREKLNA
ncbi:hypothetical protein ACKI2C_47670 [Streptomyces brasiliscabiei]|uniref:hypothetical protein n=1 Tax=Streptomyces brasiliscabiei TaxID=2736302 RepID=UPI0038F76825